MQTNGFWQIKKWNLKNSMEHWKYIYDYNQTFTDESNFGIKYSIRGWYTVKQINQTTTPDQSGTASNDNGVMTPHSSELQNWSLITKYILAS